MLKFNPQNKMSKHYIDFLLAMTEKEIKVRYKRAFFGFLWIVLNPFFQMIIMGGIFSIFIKIPNYFLFLFAGLLPWQFFSLSIGKVTPSIVNERTLLQKAKFPTEAIPVSIILANFFHLSVSLILFLPLFLILANTDILNLLILIPAMLWLLLLTIGIGLLTSSLNVKYRDVSFFVQTSIILLFYATPVIYNLSVLPDGIRLLFALNPLTSIFELLHVSLLGQGYIDKNLLLLNFGISVLLLSLGVYTFRKGKKYFVDFL